MVEGHSIIITDYYGSETNYDSAEKIIHGKSYLFLFFILYVEGMNTKGKKMRGKTAKALKRFLFSKVTGDKISPHAWRMFKKTYNNLSHRARGALLKSFHTVDVERIKVNIKTGDTIKYID